MKESIQQELKELEEELRINKISLERERESITYLKDYIEKTSIEIACEKKEEELKIFKNIQKNNQIRLREAREGVEKHSRRIKHIESELHKILREHNTYN